MTKNNGNTDYLVVLGVGSDDKPHAARFKNADEPIVRKAAELMGLRLGGAKSEPAFKLCRKLPQGRIFASGKGFVPLVKLELYEELLRVLSFDELAVPDQQEAAEPGAANLEPAAEPSKACQIDPWTIIGVGSVVLAFEEDKDGAGWWEAIIVGVSKDGNTLSLRWRDWPKTRKFSRGRYKVGIPAVTG